MDLARLAGCAPVGVVCELLNPDGTVPRPPDLRRFAAEHALRFVTVPEVVACRRALGRPLTRAVASPLPTAFGTWRAIGYESPEEGRDHLALVKGDLRARPTLAYLHTQCLLGDALGSMVCGCRDRLHGAMRRIDAGGEGVVVYQRAAAGHELSCAVPPGVGTADVAARILHDLGISALRLIGDTGDGASALRVWGLDVVAEEAELAP
jgi:3,4-dihydroxy 2-butanone 4-phosphate synthase/GTP cyclohydrolase II